MAQECMGIFERDKLPVVANVEQVSFVLFHSDIHSLIVIQNCATGITAEGKTPKKLVEEMVPLLDSREVM